MTELVDLLHTGNYSCVIGKGGEVRTFTGRGVADLYDLLSQESDFLKGASVADKVVGKGAAALMVLGGVREVYTDLISTPALEVLRKAGVAVTFGEETPFISNRDHTGMCPVEKMCSDVQSPEAMLPLIRDFLMKIRQRTLCLVVLAGLFSLSGWAQTVKEIEEVVITGTRNAIGTRYLPATVSVIDREEIEQRHDASLLPLLTEQVPGLFVTDRGIMGYGVSTGAAGGMRLRGVGGSPTTGLLVLIDGHPQYMGLMGHPLADAYQSMLAERVEVVRGPASVLYGSNAMGGVINIITRRQQQEGVHTRLNVGYGSYNTLQTEVANTVRKGRFSSIVTASYNRTDGHRPDMEFEQYSGYAKLGYDIGTHWKLYGDVNLTHFNASNPGTVQKPLIDNDSRVTRGMTSVALENRSERTSGAMSFFYNWGLHKVNDGYASGGEPQKSHFRSKDRMMGVSLYQNFELFRGNRLTVGFDYTHFGGESWNCVVATGERKPGVDKQADEFAGYIDFRQDVTAWLSLDAGIRADRHSHVGTEWIPQGGLVFHLPRRAELKAVVSKGYRNPTIREMYMFAPANPELKPERLMNYELSFSQRFHGLRYGVNLYYIKGDNLIVSNGMLPPLNVNSGKIDNRGVEVSATWQIDKRWSTHANYSLLYMKHPVLAAPEHKFYVGADYTEGRWSLSTGVQYVGGLHTSMTDSEQKENFVLWNLRGNYRISRFLNIFAKGENLLAQRYEINAGYPMPKATLMGGVQCNF